MNRRKKILTAAAVLFACVLTAGITVLAVLGAADRESWHGDTLLGLIRRDLLRYVLPLTAAAVVLLLVFNVCMVLAFRRERGTDREKPGRPVKSAGNTRLTRLLLQYFLSLMASALGLVAFAAIAWWLCGLRKWEAGIAYSFLHWCHENLVLAYVLALLAVWTAVSAAFYFRLTGYLDLLAEAAKGLARPEEPPVPLPPALEDIAARLELARTSALREIEARRNREQRQRDLIVYLAHDLKTPLTSVLGYLELLRDGGDLPAELREKYTGVALRKAERLEELIDEFFDIARFDLTEIELEKRTVDLTLMLEQVVSEFEPELAARGLTCRLELPRKLPCLCDPDKLARVFDNLLRNACFYSDPDTAVTVTGALADGETVLTFENAGRTIPREKLDRLFEPFYRLDASRASSTGGAGLGLAIARQITELHGGALTAESGEGRIVFTVHLPAP